MSSTVVPFPALVHPRPAKAYLTKDVRRDVQRLVALAPVLGEQNPESVPSVVRYVRNLVPHPPPFDGVGADEPTDTAADAVSSPLSRREQLHFERQRRLDAAHCRQIGARQIAEWLEAHPRMAACK